MGLPCVVHGSSMGHRWVFRARLWVAHGSPMSLPWIAHGYPRWCVVQAHRLPMGRLLVNLVDYSPGP